MSLGRPVLCVQKAPNRCLHYVDIVSCSITFPSPSPWHIDCPNVTIILNTDMLAENSAIPSAGTMFMGLLLHTYIWGLHMRREWRECFPHHRLQRKPLVSDPGMHHGTCVTHVPWCMSGTLTRGGGENVPGACATCNIAYPVRDPLRSRRICNIYLVLMFWQYVFYLPSRGYLKWKTRSHNINRLCQIYYLCPLFKGATWLTKIDKSYDQLKTVRLSW